MKRRLFGCLLAVLSISLVTAGPASASEDAFIEAIDSIDYYAVNCPECAEEALEVGYRVCDAFDAGGGAQGAVAEVLRSYNGPGSHPGYYAHLFAQYSAYELCPQHSDVIGQI
ncbi:DUF732 domain-containing protein [Mycobacterium lehmannii]|uniref:DUF732 domain-containing protein n=1 Tax=Mycobacterium lehmannii TaxID=2048550 RepID=UPI000B93EF08|nr:DUF732 domain-containing protein [Mycobacterium lehmannii]